MSVRITNGLRDVIANAAIAHAFDPRRDELVKLEAELAIAAYEDVFPESERKAVAKLPVNWVRRDECLRFNVGGLTINLTVKPGVPVPYRTKNSYGFGCNLLGAIQPGDLCDRIQKHAEDLEKYKSERSVARKQVYAMLSKIQTIKKLSELWLEGRQFYAKYEVEKVAALPTVRVDEINAVLGLAA